MSKIELSSQFHADDKVRKASILRGDTQILVICIIRLTTGATH